MFQINANYEQIGPDEWPTRYPECGGENQSPINITSNSLSWTLFSAFQFQNYDNDTIASFLENGHTGAFRGDRGRL